MSTHALFVDKSGNVLLDFTPLTSAAVTIPSDCVLVRLCNDDYKYSYSGSLGQLIEITNNQYTTIGNLFRYSGTYDYVDYDLLQFQGQTINFYNHSNLFNSVPHDVDTDIYDFTMYSGGGSSGGDIDFSTIVAALNSIASALSSLTNLSNLSNLTDLANIITAIRNKDNQSDIVGVLDRSFNFVDDSSSPTRKRNVFCGHGYASVSGFNNYPSTNRLNSYYSSVGGALVLLRNSLLKTNSEFYNLPALSDKLLNSLSNELSNIETKLENNLPFATLTDVTLNVDTVKKVVTQELNEKE